MRKIVQRKKTEKKEIINKRKNEQKKEMEFWREKETTTVRKRKRGYERNRIGGGAQLTKGSRKFNHPFSCNR